MATTRLRFNNLNGTLGGALTSAGTTITFAVAPAFGTVASPQYVALVLDAGTAAEEIVYLTAYTSGATTGTITRGQEGTTGVTHTSTGTWAVNPTAGDFITYDPVTGEASVTDLAVSGLTGATNGTRYVGSWGGPGAPTTGTFAVGDFGIDLATPAVWVCTTAGTIGSGCVFKNAAAVSSLGSAVAVSLTDTTTYPPASMLKGNTGLAVVQNQTLSFLPPVSTITTNGTIWTITFASSILGTVGQVGDTFPCWTAGFVPTGYNVGNSASTYTATVTSTTTITIPNATTGLGTLTAFGQVVTNPVQETTITTGAGLGYTRAILEVEGTNTFATSVSGLFGLGPAVQNAMQYTNATPVTKTVNVTASSSVFTISGDQRSSIFPGMRIAAQANLAGGSSQVYVTSVSYNGTLTTVVAYVGYFIATWYGTTGTAAFTFVNDIATGEGFVNAPTTIATGTAVSFPINQTTFGLPGQGQGWALGFWTGNVFATASGGTLANVNTADYGANVFMTAGTSGLNRWGYQFNDVSTTSNGGGGTMNQQIGVLVARENNDLTFDPCYGATQNVGILNASTEFAPSQSPMTTVAVASNGVSISTGLFVGSGGPPLTGGTGTLNVASTAGFPSTGTIKLNAGGGIAGLSVLNYTGITSTSFTGCTFQSGTGGTVGTGFGVIAATSYINMAAIPFTASSATYLPTPLATTMMIQSTSAVTLPTALATIGGGGYTPPYDGQVLKLINVGTFAVTFTSSASVSTTAILLGATTRVLSKGGSLHLQWSASLSQWIEISYAPGTTKPINTNGSNTSSVATVVLECAGGTATTGTLPTSGTAFTPSATQDTMLSVASGVTATTIQVTYGPSTGAEHTICNATSGLSRFASGLIPAGWKVIITATAISSLNTILAITC